MRVLVLGGINLDVQAKSYRPFLPADSNPGSVSWSPGGVGRNISENLVRLGVQVELLSVFGGDPAAAYLLDSCLKLGIETGRSLILPEASSSQYLCLLDSDGKLAGAVAAMDLFESLTPQHLRTAAAGGGNPDFVVVDANLPQAVIEEALRLWPELPFLYDPVSETKAPRGAAGLGGFSLVKPNRLEARMLTGCDTDTDSGLQQAARELHGRGVKEVYLSLGAEGLFYSDSSGQGFVTPPAASLKGTLVNLSGAGDAASAALVWGSLQGFSSPVKATLAVAAATLTSRALETVSTSMNPQALLELSKSLPRRTL